MKETQSVKNENEWNKYLKHYESELIRLKILCTAFILVSFVLVAIAGYFIVVGVNNRDTTIRDLNNQVNELLLHKESLSRIGYTVEELEKKADELNKQIEEKQSQLNSLDQSISEKQIQLDNMSYDVDLINKYNYALYDTAGNRNDITLDLLKLIDMKCNEKEIDPDLVLGIIMVESEGHSGATNSYSGAAGLGQFMPDTGEFVANKYLNLSYDHSTTPYDSATNIFMMIEYLSYLYDRYYGDTVSVLMEYSGGDLEYAYEYYAKVIRAVGHHVA